MMLFDRSGIERVPNGTASNKPVYRYQTNCSRCGGAGGSDRWAHTGYKCFDCGGHGKGPIREAKLYTVEKLAQLNATAAKRQAKALAKRQARDAEIAAERAARRDAFRTDNAEFLKKLGSLDGDFWGEMYASMIERATPPSPRQIEIVDAEIARRAQRAASGYARFGSRFMFLARDMAGNRIVYRGNGDFPREGESATLAATVAEHTEYKGERQTIVQRPKVQVAA